MTIHPCLFHSLFAAGISMAAAAVLRRVVRREYASLLPWLTVWGILCTIPALLFIVLCLPGFEETADQLRKSMTWTEMALLTGAAGVLPGLLWDETAERLEQRRALPFGLPKAFFRALLIAALVVVVLVPYGFLFNRQPAETEQTTANPANAEPAPETAAAAAEPDSPIAEIASSTEIPPTPVQISTDSPEN